jgi:hypothetical protein
MKQLSTKEKGRPCWAALAISRRSKSGSRQHEQMTARYSAQVHCHVHAKPVEIRGHLCYL